MMVEGGEEVERVEEVEGIERIEEVGRKSIGKNQAKK
jgi:hypothetical protein